MIGRRTKLLNINILACSKAAKKCKHLLHCTESLKHDDNLVNKCKMNINAEF